MPAGRRILIAGIGTHWGTELALRLERDPDVEQVLGIDTTPPLAELERTEFLEADIRSPLLARLLPSTGADTLVHTGILWYPEPGKPQRALHDINVIGTLQLLHAEDATGALLAAAMNPIRGAVNVAPSGSISLSRALRLIDRPQLPIPHPLFGPAMARLGDRLGAGSLYGDAVRLLRYGRGVDNARLRTELGYEPRFDAVAAVRDFAAADRGLRLVPVPGVGSVLDRLAGSR